MASKKQIAAIVDKIVDLVIEEAEAAKLSRVETLGTLDWAHSVIRKRLLADVE